MEPLNKGHVGIGTQWNPLIRDMLVLVPTVKPLIRDTMVLVPYTVEPLNKGRVGIGAYAVEPLVQSGTP